MVKAYSRINWQNQPSTATAVGATNLNKLDLATNSIDDRVVAMDISKANASVVNALVKNVTFNSVNGQFTVTYQNGTTAIIDTVMEKVVTNFTFNSTTQKIDLVLADGTTQSIDISSFVTNVDFKNSPTIGFSLDVGKTRADIVDGSVTAEKLQPNYLADITVQAQIASTQALQSKRYAVGGVQAGDLTDNALYYKQQAEYYAEQAQAIVGFEVDMVPTDGSNNPVASNGVFDALGGKAPTVHNHDDRYHTETETVNLINAAVAGLVNSSPTTLDTLKELATALGNDPNFATTIANALGLKAPSLNPVFTNAKSVVGTDYAVARHRNIYLTTVVPTTVPAGLGNGDLIFVHE